MKYLLGVGVVFFAAAAACAGETPTKQDLELRLKAVQADKEKYIARFNWGQSMMDEAQRALPAVLEQEQALIKQLDQTNGKKTVSVPQAAPPKVGGK